MRSSNLAPAGNLAAVLTAASLKARSGVGAMPRTLAPQRAVAVTPALWTKANFTEAFLHFSNLRARPIALRNLALCVEAAVAEGSAAYIPRLRWDRFRLSKRPAHLCAKSSPTPREAW